jgi:hypothetical protein
VLLYSPTNGANEIESEVATTAGYRFFEFEGAPDPCPETLKLTAFDVGKGTDGTQEFVSISNTGPEPALVTGCALVLYKARGGARTYYATDLIGAVEPGDTFVVGTPGVPAARQTFPDNTLDDGPGAITLYQQPAADFPNGTKVTINDNLISSILYGTGRGFRIKRAGSAGAADVLRALSDLEETAADVPEVATLEGSAPNPTRDRAEIRYALPADAPVSLELYDVLGRRVMSIESGEKQAGWHTVTLDARPLASGTYFYVLRAGDQVLSRPLRVVK